MRLRFLYIFFLLLLSASNINGQSYGLEFTAREKNLDYRTELDLNPRKNFKFKEDFELSFDFLLRKKKIPTSYFGYIFRIISDDQYNIDLIHNNTFEDKKGLNLILGQNASKISYDFDSASHYNHWINIRLRFNISKNELEIIFPDTTLIESNIPIDDKQSLKIVFGASNYSPFKTRDIPPFNLRDVKIFVEGQLQYHWPLDEYEGTEAKDIIQNKVALIRNPNWIKKMHLEWNKNFQTTMAGNTSVAVNEEDEKIYIIGANEVIDYSIQDESYEIIKYEEKPMLSPGEQAVYFAKTNSIYCYSVDDHRVSVFDLTNRKWNLTNPLNKDLTAYWHHNKYLSTSDTMLYIFGGYGYHEYKNTVKIVDLNSGEWRIAPKNWDETYKPRYLAALGGNQDTLYLLGGFGSPSGDQMINPQNYHELLAYSIKDNHFVHKFDLPMSMEDFSFGNSMIIDSEDNSYYALAFSLVKVDNSLQLVRGNLNEPTLELIANQISYTHLGNHSYVDLFYFPKSKYLVAYTGFKDPEDNTIIELHRLKFPPILTTIESKSPTYINQFNTIVILVLLVFALLTLIYLKNRKKKSRLNKERISPVRNEDYTESQAAIKSTNSEQKTSSIYFFGGFQVYDRSGNEITGKFTPLLKELFLIIWLHTLKNNKGISSDRLTETLWFDKSQRSARNNKAVNIAKLRAILSEIGNCEVSHKTGYWKIICDDKEVYNDYLNLLNITQSKTNLSKKSIQQIIQISEQGAFLENLSYDWLDDFKASISETIIETLYAFARERNIKKEASMIIRIADCVFSCDSINEEAMFLKCKAHFEMGAHSLAKSSYTKFCKDYQELYGQDYNKSFTTITATSLDELLSF